MELLLQPDNLPFTIALALLFAFAGIELITMMLGMGVFASLDDWLPDFDVGAEVDGEISGDAMDASDGMWAGVFGWLMLGKAPFLVIVSIFLTVFALVGLGIQFTSHSSIGYFLPRWLVSLIAIVVALPVMRYLAATVARFMPKEETSAISHNSFLGRLATIVQGTARKNHPAQARFQDEFRQTHYVLVEPENKEDSFTQGEQVVLVEHIRAGSFIAIPFKNKD